MRDVFTYDEFGNQGGNVNSSYPFRYTGQKWDPRTSLYYYKARHYDPKLGRFLQPDPIGYGDGLNMYNYVGGDPVNRRDPSGLAKISANEQDPGFRHRDYRNRQDVDNIVVIGTVTKPPASFGAPSFDLASAVSSVSTESILDTIVVKATKKIRTIKTNQGVP